MQRYTVLLLATIFCLSGCVFSGEKAQPPEESPIEQEVEVVPEEVEAALYSTFEDFFAAIVLQGDKRPNANQTEEFLYDHNATGIQSFYPKQFYRDNRLEDQVIEDQLGILADSELIFSQESSRDRMRRSISKMLAGENGSEAFLDTVDQLESLEVADLTGREYEQLIYMYSLSGEYTKGQELEKSYCSTSDCDRSTSDISISVMTESETPLVANLQLLNTGKEIGQTNKKGVIDFAHVSRGPELLRIRVTAAGYATGFVDVLADGTAREATITLYAADGSVTIDPNQDLVEVSDGVTVELKNGAYHIKNKEASTFIIKPEQVRKPNGKPHRGKFSVQVFDFLDEPGISENYLSQAIIESEMVAPWNQFNTFGMPWIELTDGNGRPLKVTKENPLQIQTKYIRKPEFIKPNGTPDFFTKSEWNKVRKFSANSKEEYPLTRESIEALIGRDIGDPSVATWWVFNREKGVWEFSKFKLLKDGETIVAPFYTAP